MKNYGCSQKYRNKKGETSGSLGKLGAMKKGTQTSDRKFFLLEMKK